VLEALGDAAAPSWDEVLGSVTRELLTSEDRERGSDQLAEFFARHGAAMLHDCEVMFSVVPAERQENFRILAAAGPWAEGLIGREWPQAGTVAGEALALRRPVETTRLQERTQSVLKSLIEAGAINTGRLVPLVGQDPLPDGRTALGVMGFYRRQKAPFTRAERRLIGEYSHVVTFALYQVELRAMAADAAARLRIGVDLAMELSSSLEPVPVVRRLLERAAAACTAERAALLRVEGEYTVVEDSFDTEGHPEALGYRHPIAAQPLMERAVSSGRPVIGGAYDAADLPPPLDKVLRAMTHTVTLPLVFAGRVIAVLVLSRRRDVPFSSGDVEMLRLVGNLAVLALRNSWLYSEAQEASRARGEFLNLAAHELRTPLTIIIGYLSMLREGSFGPPPEAWQQPLSTLAAKTAELATLIEDLLLASRLETDAMRAESQQVDVRDAVAAAVERAEPRARLLGARLVTRMVERPVQANIDADHLGRVLDNLLNNALSYSPIDPVVTVELEADPEPRISVIDNGVGVAPEHRERIFERFYRLEESAHAGTGLGLYISRQLIGRSGGSLELAWTEVGRGSRFTVRLPAR
jgi:signal transduction histidine kinase